MTTPTWAQVADLSLELQGTRERLAAIDEDLVELVAHQRFAFYRQLGGQELTEGAFRAKVRHYLRTGETI